MGQTICRKAPLHTQSEQQQQTFGTEHHRQLPFVALENKAQLTSINTGKINKAEPSSALVDMVLSSRLAAKFPL